ncbi:MAG: methyltransferase domain-containing protein [Chloroflexi bacterium]|nr:methyltransferase domain-containing protein [Chloroflexota bacterium]
MTARSENSDLSEVKGQSPARPCSRNYVKHTSRSAAQRWLLDRFHRALLELVRTSVAGRPDATGLEVGCGEGFVLDILRGRVPGLHLEGLDVSWGALSMARERLAAMPLYVADACRLPFSDGAFDLVLCLEVLEHLEQPAQALAEAARVSRRDVIISVPHQPFFSLANLLRGKNLGALGDDPEHRTRWGAASFLAFVGQALEIKRVRYPFPWILVLGVTG